MIRKIFKKKSIIVIAVIMLMIIFLIGIRLTAAPDRVQLTQIEIILRDSIAPLYSGVTQISNTIVNIGNSIAAYNELLEENRILREQIRDLTLQNSMMEEFRRENQRLSEILNIRQMHEGQLELVTARVIARDLGNWFDVITIDKGTNHGVSVGMAVINHQGLVGRVTATSRNTAEVMLLLDRESAVGAMNQRSRDFGWVESTIVGDYPLQMMRIHPDASLEVGDVIVTSGLGEGFPRGLKIGKIVAISPAPTGLVQQAMIIPFVEFNRLEEVMVITHVIASPYDEVLLEGEDE